MTLFPFKDFILKLPGITFKNYRYYLKMPSTFKTFKKKRNLSTFEIWNYINIKERVADPKTVKMKSIIWKPFSTNLLK